MSDTKVPHEIGDNYQNTRILVVGRDPGQHEVIQRRPFVGPAGQMLEEGLLVAGLRRSDVAITNVCKYRPKDDVFGNHDPAHVVEGIAELWELIADIDPKLVVALGNEAAYVLVGGGGVEPGMNKIWPGSTIFSASGIMDRRGYFWYDMVRWTFTTIHPAAVLHKVIPNVWLFEQDMERINQWRWGTLREEAWPQVVMVRGMKDLEPLLQAKYVAADIETQYEGREILCCAFCGDNDYVPRVVPKTLLPLAFDYLRRDIRFVWHHGLYDVCLLRREGVEVSSSFEDTSILWWALEPEIAANAVEEGSAAYTHSSYMTRKSLAFLASIYLNVPYWKNYDTDTEGMYTLNGRDAYTTIRVFHKMMKEVRKMPAPRRQHVARQYARKKDQIPIALWMQMRGLHVDNALRGERLSALRVRSSALANEVVRAGEEVIQELRPPAFIQTVTCSCCGGTRQAKRCWTCAGFEKPPKRKEDYARVLGEGTVAELKEKVGPCARCDGTGRVEALGGRSTERNPEWSWNPFSTTQMSNLLKALGVPKSVLSDRADEESLQKALIWAMS